MTSARSEAETRLREAVEQRQARCAVIGLGFVGSTLMDALVAAGFDAHGYDRVSAVASRFLAQPEGPRPQEGRVRTAGDDPGAVADADVVIVAVRALVGSGGSVDLEPLKSAAALLSSYVRPEGRLILVESTVPPGTTRAFASEWLEAGPDSADFVAHSPERLSVGHDWCDFREIPHLVGGVDEAATRLAGQFLARIGTTVVPVSRPEVSELSKLLENAFLSVGVGLVGEITHLAHGLGIPASEVCDAAASKTAGYYPFRPGPGLGGHCLPNDLGILQAAGKDLGRDTPLIEATIRSTARQPRGVVERLEALMLRDGRSLRGAEVLLVGVGFKIGSSDTTASPSGEVVRILRARGARPVYMDSQVPAFAIDDDAVERIVPAALDARRFPAGIVLSGDAAVDAAALEQAVDLLLDAGGGRLLRGALQGAHRL